MRSPALPPARGPKPAARRWGPLPRRDPRERGPGLHRPYRRHGAGRPELLAVGGDVFPASAEAVKQSRVLFFPRDRFISLITEDPTLALNMLAVLSKSLRQFTVQIENLSLKEVPGRLAGYLLLLSEEQQNRVEVKLHISKGHLASFLGTIPETLSRILKKMSEQDLIQVNGRNISITDYEGLEILAESGRLDENGG
mgnify:CR=1 FL=1